MPEDFTTATQPINLDNFAFKQINEKGRVGFEWEVTLGNEKYFLKCFPAGNSPKTLEEAKKQLIPQIEKLVKLAVEVDLTSSECEVSSIRLEANDKMEFKNLKAKLKGGDYVDYPQHLQTKIIKLEEQKVTIQGDTQLNQTTKIDKVQQMDTQIEVLKDKIERLRKICELAIDILGTRKKSPEQAAPPKVEDEAVKANNTYVEIMAQPKKPAKKPPPKRPPPKNIEGIKESSASIQTFLNQTNLNLEKADEFITTMPTDDLWKEFPKVKGNVKKEIGKEIKEYRELIDASKNEVQNYLKLLNEELTGKADIPAAYNTFIAKNADGVEKFHEALEKLARPTPTIDTCFRLMHADTDFSDDEKKSFLSHKPNMMLQSVSGLFTSLKQLNVPVENELKFIQELSHKQRPLVKMKLFEDVVADQSWDLGEKEVKILNLAVRVISDSHKHLIENFEQVRKNLIRVRDQSWNEKALTEAIGKNEAFQNLRGLTIDGCRKELKDAFDRYISIMDATKPQLESYLESYKTATENKLDLNSHLNFINGSGIFNALRKLMIPTPEIDGVFQLVGESSEKFQPKRMFTSVFDFMSQVKNNLVKELDYAKRGVIIHDPKIREMIFAKDVEKVDIELLKLIAQRINNGDFKRAEGDLEAVFLEPLENDEKKLLKPSELLPAEKPTFPVKTPYKNEAILERIPSAARAAISQVLGQLPVNDEAIQSFEKYVTENEEVDVQHWLIEQRWLSPDPWSQRKYDRLNADFENLINKKSLVLQSLAKEVISERASVSKKDFEASKAEAQMITRKEKAFPKKSLVPGKPLEHEIKQGLPANESPGLLTGIFNRVRQWWSPPKPAVLEKKVSVDKLAAQEKTVKYKETPIPEKKFPKKSLVPGKPLEHEIKQGLPVNESPGLLTGIFNRVRQWWSPPKPAVLEKKVSVDKLAAQEKTVKYKETPIPEKKFPTKDIKQGQPLVKEVVSKGISVSTEDFKLSKAKAQTIVRKDLPLPPPSPLVQPFKELIDNDETFYKNVQDCLHYLELAREKALKLTPQKLKKYDALADFFSIGEFASNKDKIIKSFDEIIEKINSNLKTFESYKNEMKKLKHELNLQNPLPAIQHFATFFNTNPLANEYLNALGSIAFSYNAELFTPFLEKVASPISPAIFAQRGPRIEMPLNQIKDRIEDDALKNEFDSAATKLGAKLREITKNLPFHLSPLIGKIPDEDKTEMKTLIRNDQVKSEAELIDWVSKKSQIYRDRLEAVQFFSEELSKLQQQLNWVNILTEQGKNVAEDIINQILPRYRKNPKKAIKDITASIQLAKEKIGNDDPKKLNTRLRELQAIINDYKNKMRKEKFKISDEEFQKNLLKFLERLTSKWESYAEIDQLDLFLTEEKTPEQIKEWIISKIGQLQLEKSKLKGEVNRLLEEIKAKDSPREKLDIKENLRNYARSIALQHRKAAEMERMGKELFGPSFKAEFATDAEVDSLLAPPSETQYQSIPSAPQEMEIEVEAPKPREMHLTLKKKKAKEAKETLQLAAQLLEGSVPEVQKTKLQRQAAFIRERIYLSPEEFENFNLSHVLFKNALTENGYEIIKVLENQNKILTDLHGKLNLPLEDLYEEFRKNPNGFLTNHQSNSDLCTYVKCRAVQEYLAERSNL